MTTVRELIGEGYISVTDSATVAETIEAVREFTPGADTTIYYVYVTSEDGTLAGVASLRELLNGDGDAPVTDVTTTELVELAPSTTAEDATEAFATYGFQAIPVCDEGGHLLGVVRVSDIIDALDEESAKDVLSEFPSFQPFGD